MDRTRAATTTLTGWSGRSPRFVRASRARSASSVDDLPLPEFDPEIFWRHWLAARNLGLVPIADPATFEWPGYWIAASADPTGGRDAVLMFGAPSGPLLDRAGVFRDNDSIVEAVAIAPFDLGLAPAAPYGAAPEANGVVAGLLVAPVATQALVRIDEARAVAGRGLEGDRYEIGAGTFSGTGRGYQLTLVETEALDGARADGTEITWEEARRNVVTRGIELNALVDRRFRIGEVECIGRRLAEPCAHLQSLTPAGALRALVRRGGLRADIVGSGTVRVGDPVVPLDERDGGANV